MRASQEHCYQLLKTSIYLIQKKCIKVNQHEHIRHNKSISRCYCWFGLILWTINSITTARYIIKLIERSEDDNK